MLQNLAEESSNTMQGAEKQMAIGIVGIVDASKHGVGGVVFGEGSKCIPTVFRWQWPEENSIDVKTETQ